MSKISDAFKNGKAFIGFITAGDPNLETSEEIILKMAEGGCDIIEIGIPFSDPIAEGVVIQNSNVRALKGGATTDKVFELTKKISQKTAVPLVYTAFLNVLFKYGYNSFLQKAVDAGVSGVIIPDLPIEEQGELTSVAEKYGVDVISLVAANDENRIKMIAKNARGFIYETLCSEDDLQFVNSAVKAVSDIPTAVSVNIDTPEKAKRCAEIADGVVINAQIVTVIAENPENAPQAVYDYVKTIKDAI